MKLLDYITQWAENVGIQAAPKEDSILFPVNGENGSWYARVSAIEEDDVVFVVTAYPFQVAENARTKTAVALSTMTSQLKMGAFYIDPEDGQVNFRLSQRIPKGEDRGQWIGELIMLTMNVTDSYYRKIMSFAAEE